MISLEEAIKGSIEKWEDIKEDIGISAIGVECDLCDYAEDIGDETESPIKCVWCPLYAEERPCFEQEPYKTIYEACVNNFYYYLDDMPSGLKDLTLQYADQLIAKLTKLLEEIND